MFIQNKETQPMTKLEKLLKESTLPEDFKSVILEAWNDEKQNLAAEIRDEMKTRFEQDKNAILEGLQAMTDEVINEEMKKVYTEKQKLSEDRAVIRSNLQNFSNFANGILAKEITELRQDRASLQEGVKRFADFSNGIIAKELMEFHQDKKNLVEARVKLLAEGKQKIKEAQEQYVQKLTKNAARFIQEQTSKELTELRTQLHEAQKNMFGRKIFEAFASEFMATQYNENAEMRRILESHRVLKTELNEAKDQLEVASDAIADHKRTIRIMEDNSARKDIMQNLMRPLNNSQKVVMEGLLQKTPTAQLEQDFKKYLKPVLRESSDVKPAAARSNLTESQKDFTGDRKQKALYENHQEDSNFDEDLSTLQKFAGIRK